MIIIKYRNDYIKYYNSKDEIKKIMLDKYQGDLGGTMIIDKKNNDSFEQKWVW